MRVDDLGEVDALWREAFLGLEGAAPPVERRPEAVALDLSRLAHLLGTDPGGSSVAEAEGRLVGFAQAHRREGTFVLAMLGVLPAFQERGIGRGLLERALSYGEGTRAQYIFSSMDPRALHRYVRAGFALRPTVFATPRPTAAAAAVPLEVAAGDAEEIAFVGEVDRAVRGSARPADFQFLLGVGQRLVLDERGGYAVLGTNRVSALAARSEEIARSLLERVLRAPGEHELCWMVAEQQWAIETAAHLGLALRVRGALMSHGTGALPRPYLPNGLFG